VGHLGYDVSSGIGYVLEISVEVNG